MESVGRETSVTAGDLHRSRRDAERRAVPVEWGAGVQEISVGEKRALWWSRRANRGEGGRRGEDSRRDWKGNRRRRRCRDRLEVRVRRHDRSGVIVLDTRMQGGKPAIHIADLLLNGRSKGGGHGGHREGGDRRGLHIGADRRGQGSLCRKGGVRGRAPWCGMGRRGHRGRRKGANGWVDGRRWKSGRQMFGIMIQNRMREGLRGRGGWRRDALNCGRGRRKGCVLQHVSPELGLVRRRRAVGQLHRWGNNSSKLTGEIT